MTRRKTGVPSDPPAPAATPAPPVRTPVALVSADDKGNGGARPKPEPPKAAFDVWLERGLHQMFDDVAREPIPEELLRLINDDRPK